LACSIAAAAAAFGATGARSAAASQSHIVLIILENKESSNVLGSGSAQFENQLARRGGLATASYAITHPSLPKLPRTHEPVPRTAFSSDCTSCSVNAPNLVDQLTSAGISWKAYLQDVPGPCFTGTSAG